jgi:RNA polymerase sigma factor (TIGR02999 family)
MTDPQATVTRLLEQAAEGDRSAVDALFPLVYDELRQLARVQRRRRDGAETLNTTALIHEAYLRLVDQSSPVWRDRTHFLAVASRAMRHILIDYARARRARKRGGTRPHVSLDEIEATLGEPRAEPEAVADALLAVEESLKRLERHSERQSRIVECRVFGGLTIHETAEALGLAPATVKRGWAAAQAWLYRDLRQTLAPSS